jgi:hypothetical protein
VLLRGEMLGIVRWPLFAPQHPLRSSNAAQRQIERQASKVPPDCSLSQSSMHRDKPLPSQRMPRDLHRMAVVLLQTIDHGVIRFAAKEILVQNERPGIYQNARRRPWALRRNAADDASICAVQYIYLVHPRRHPAPFILQLLVQLCVKSVVE